MNPAPLRSPTPSAISVALWRGLDAGFMARGGYWLHTWVTVWEVLLGFFIGSGVGLLLGTIISQFRIIEATLRIYLVAIQSLPKIALAPIISFGGGSAPPWVRSTRPVAARAAMSRRIVIAETRPSRRRRSATETSSPVSAIRATMRSRRAVIVLTISCAAARLIRPKTTRNRSNARRTT